MAGTRITIDASGLDRLQVNLRTLADGTRDTSALLPRLGEYLLSSAKGRFKSQADPGGGPWAALAPRTLARKRKNKDKVLTLSGMLRSKLRYQLVGKNAVEVGSHFVYAATHQYGRGGISARPFLGLSATDRQEIAAIVADWAADLGYK